MDFASLSPRKKIFLVLGVIVLVLIIVALVKLNSSTQASTKKVSSAKELNVWVVRDESAGFTDIINEFKKQPAYAATDVKVTKFGSYADYERTLINVLADGNGPDVFVVNNNGGVQLESKITPITGSGVIGVADFQKRFARVFDELVVTQKEKNESGEDVSMQYIKGIPMGYETLGVFYNWKLIKNVPLTWSDIDREIQTNSGAEFAMVGLGLDGKRVIGAPDILSLFFLQNGVTSYKNMGDVAAVNGATSYLNYGSDSANYLVTLRDEMQSVGLNVVDEFVRGKVAMIFGYPSLLTEIEYSIKRAGPELAINDRFLRTEVVPQVFDTKGKMVNLANYSYFAVSKSSKNQDAAMAFLAHLATSSSEKSYLKNFPIYLPAQSEFEAERLGGSISTQYDKVRYQSFLRDGVDNVSFDKGLKSVYDEYFNSELTSGSGATSYQDMLAGGVKYIDCQINHYIHNTNYEDECVMKKK